MCSSRTSAEITGTALGGGGFGLLLSVGDGFCVSFSFLSHVAYELLRALSYNYV